MLDGDDCSTRLGKMAKLGWKNPKLMHVQSLRSQVFMFLDSLWTLEVSFRHGDVYMVYASSDQIKCFDCGDIGHKRLTCPHKQPAALLAAAAGGKQLAAAAPALAAAPAENECELSSSFGADAGDAIPVSVPQTDNTGVNCVNSV